MAAWLDDLEREHGSTLVQCQDCQDFRTNVTNGREHPCAACQPGSWAEWQARADALMPTSTARMRELL